MIRDKIIALVIASTIAFSNTSSIFALQSGTHLSDISNTITTKLEDGVYTIENDALYIDKDKESVARKYLNKTSKVEIKEGIISIIFSFTEKDVINNMKFTLDDKEISYEIVNEDEKTIDYKLIINTIDDILKVNADIKTPLFPNPMNVDFRISLKSNTLIKLDENNGDNENNNQEDNNQTDDKVEDLPNTDNSNQESNNGNDNQSNEEN